MNKLLKNKTILITKELEGDNSLISLTNAGANIIYFPTIKILPFKNNEALDKALQNFSCYDYLIFTSANAAEIFFEYSKNYNINLANSKIVAVGKKTSNACKSLGMKVSLIPNNFSANGIIELFRDENIVKKRILIPCSAIADKNLKKELNELGAKVDAIPIYDVEVNDKSKLTETINFIIKQKPDVFIFTSPSTFKAFLTLMELSNPTVYFNNTLVAAIGPTTETAIKEYKVTVNIIPKKSTLEDLEKAIIEYFLFNEK
ncbi:uroporphyrinogen-III synthase [Melioribacteraceae bacterium 4301-Me]|uniref:uroporphyrinogen-III synthase n=1 Tax=Pyranulibacter aquaticus TaxID=3163344 RepID=UPI00359BF2F4